MFLTILLSAAISFLVFGFFGDEKGFAVFGTILLLMYGAGHDIDKRFSIKTCPKCIEIHATHTNSTATVELP